MTVVAVYLGTTGALPLVGRDEPRYVQIGRAMLESGDWITPRLGGFHWFEKPILLYWMVAASFGVFGVNEWAARLGPALCGLGSAALLWWMVRPISENAARWSALVAASSIGLLAFSHGATFDIVLTFCLTLALAAWWKSHIESDGQRATRLLALFWVGVGLSFFGQRSDRLYSARADAGDLRGAGRGYGAKSGQAQNRIMVGFAARACGRRDLVWAGDLGQRDGVRQYLFRAAPFRALHFR